MQLPFKKLDPAAQLPVYATEGAAGMDIFALTRTNIPTLGWGIVPTGLSAAIPDGYELQVRPRSGLAAKQGITVLNAPGTIDSDYRGEIKVILYNGSDTDAVVMPGDRIAQLVLAPVVQATVVGVEELDETARGTNGFGSTGT